jgi:acyl CoA:acetate/3-ketoacid CoA transferase
MSKEFWRGVWRSKTMWLGHVTVTIGMITAKYPDILSKEQMAAYMLAAGILGYWFRVKTDGTLTERGR